MKQELTLSSPTTLGAVLKALELGGVVGSSVTKTTKRLG